MNRKELSQIRRHLGKTQMEMAQLLGVSVKGIQSFEQGWRGIPAASEREVLMLLGLKRAFVRGKRPCWSVKRCSEENRRKCPVWEFGAGNICWLFNGTVCRGKADSWAQKTKKCRKCEVFQSTFDLDDRGGFALRSDAEAVCSARDRQ